LNPADRHLEGRTHTAQVLNWWMLRLGYTHAMATALAAWVCGDSSWLQGSQLSHLRNSRMRTPQLKLFEGLAGFNAAVAHWRQHGPAACEQRWGPLPSLAPAPSAMDTALFLWHPEQGEDVPLVFRDFCDLFVGLLHLPYVDQGGLSPGQSRLISDHIGQELDRWLIDQGGIRQGMAQLQDLYPASSPSRRQKLRQVILGLESYNPVELDEEIFAMGALFSAVRGKPVSGSELFAELSRVPHLPQD
jgi:hypothetical protein